ncbi:E3 ubiquitin-protein ligase [Quillaja saponaria]|uniref:RING-type E3 ubiquitin transferase n=1 Tax=Quillaja saponaria TaxID=32244 RepID=A0AAD7Q6I9_QUISA|nr:E3 ubiquitin-protein ligase [Quillaja saponaria]
MMLVRDSSDTWQKRRRVSLRYSTVDLQREPVNVEDESDAEEEEEEESDEECDDECVVVSDDTDEGEGEFDEEEQDQGRISGHASNGSNQVDTHWEGPSRDAPISVNLIDPEVLDCCICYEPLSIPVFQCENGHTVCSSCCTKITHKCAFCACAIGYNRCRAIEKVLESLRISCNNAEYGCQETMSYSEKKDHEKTCIYVPCLCPHSDCNFAAPVTVLSLHFSVNHRNSAMSFIYNSFFPICLSATEKYLVLQEQNEGVLFILHNHMELVGNIVTVTCIGPCLSKVGAYYELSAKSDQGSCLRLQSYAKITQGRVTDIPSPGCLLIPFGFFWFLRAAQVGPQHME